MDGVRITSYNVCYTKLLRIGQHLILLLVGATETFPKAFASAVHRLWQHRDQRRELAAHPEWIPMALRECLRYDMPTQFAMRKSYNFV